MKIFSNKTNKNKNKSNNININIPEQLPSARLFLPR